MSYTLLYHPKVIADDIPKLDQKTRKKIKTAIEQKLLTHPEVFGVPLRQSLKGHRKLRVGDYRIVFRIQGNTILILLIAHRSIVYRRADSRMVV